MKKLHRLILLSSVYQQASDDSNEVERESSVTPISLKKSRLDGISPYQVDPENKLLSHMNRQRLDFESLRDSLLFASGQLDLKLGGKAEELFKVPFSKRRSIYGFIDRQFLPGALRVFDFANPDMHNPQRAETTVPQQALFFMNGPFAVEQSRALAARSETKSSEEKIRRFYRVVFQREPMARQVQFGNDFIKAANSEIAEEESAKKIPSAWKYGWGEFDETAKQIKNFQPLPHFSGDAWQGGEKWPDAKLGWAQLTATGGHAGDDLQHAVMRRWTSPVDGAISIEGTIKHERTPGHGIRAYIFSGQYGLLGNWMLHNQSADAKFDNLEVKKGDTIDFIVSINQSLNNNDFMWTPVIRMVGSKSIRDANGYAKEWNSKKEFAGQASENQKPLTAWEKYAQVLLLSNEFLFID